MLFIDTTAPPKTWLHLGMADCLFSQALCTSKVGVLRSQLTCFRVTRWPECLWKLPPGLRKSVLAFMLVLFAGERYSDLHFTVRSAASQGWKKKKLRVQLATRSFWTKSEIRIFTIQVKFCLWGFHRWAGWNRFICFGVEIKPWNVNSWGEGNLCGCKDLTIRL